MIRITPWKGHIVISIPIYQEWDSPNIESMRIHIWTDHHWGKGISKI